MNLAEKIQQLTETHDRVVIEAQKHQAEAEKLRNTAIYYEGQIAALEELQKEAHDAQDALLDNPVPGGVVAGNGEYIVESGANDTVTVA